MATRKKTTPESETMKPEERVQASRKASARTVRSRMAAQPAEGGKEKASAKASAPAATHKAPARKPAAEQTPEAHSAVEMPAFDTAPHHQEIAREAYFNWLRRGCPHGSAQVDWLAAVALVRARHRR